MPNLSSTKGQVLKVSKLIFIRGELKYINRGFESRSNSSKLKKKRPLWTTIIREKKFFKTFLRGNRNPFQPFLKVDRRKEYFLELKYIKRGFESRSNSSKLKKKRPLWTTIIREKKFFKTFLRGNRNPFQLFLEGERRKEYFLHSF